MLTARTAPRGASTGARLLVLLAAAATLLVSLVALASPASAARPGCHLEQVKVGQTLVWTEVCPGSDGGDGGSEGGEGGPTCTLTGLQDYCIGDVGCWMNYPAAVPPTPEQEAQKPSPAAVWVYQRCNEDTEHPLSGWTWREDVGPSPAELAQQAFGQLAAPAFTLAFNPPGRTVVGVPTWFWASTANGGAISGTSLTVTAVAEPSHLEVDPGTGSGTLTCPWAVTPGDACTSTYTRSSAAQPVGADGQPAYTARMRLVYDVRFEIGGEPLSLPGLPTEFSSPWVTNDVPVAEVQTVVVR